MAKAKAEEATGRIVIVSMPRGDAPVNIRRAWLNKTVPCYSYVGMPAGMVKDVITSRSTRIERIGVLVPQNRALQVLRQYSRWAAMWWEDQGFPQVDGCFFFSEDEYRIQSGVDLTATRVLINNDIGHWGFMSN